jgi:hypothetical protein
MLRARQAVESRSWSHPQEPTTEEWWAHVLADPRAQVKRRGSEQAVSRTFYRLADEPRDTILSLAANATGKPLSGAMSCSPHTAGPARCRAYSSGSPRQAVSRSAHSGTAAASTMSTPLRDSVTCRQARQPKRLRAAARGILEPTAA